MCIPLETGDKGQRYEVICLDERDRQKTVGWADTQKGADSLVLGVNLHPSMHSPDIIDRQKSK